MKTLTALLAAVALLGGCASDGMFEGSSGASDPWTQSYYGDATNPTYPDLYFGD